MWRLFYILDVSFKEPFVGLVTDPVNAHIFFLDSCLQLTIQDVSPLPLPGYSSRGRRHADLCFCLGVSPLSPPRPPGRSRQRNPSCCLQYGSRKGSLHTTNIAAAWGKRAEGVSDHCCNFLVDWPPTVPSSFFGLATNTLNVRNNKHFPP